MVVAWEIRNEAGDLVTTFFDEKKAISARDRLEARGDVVRLDKVFDHHLKEREPVVKKVRKTPKYYLKNVADLIPKGTHPVMIFIRPGDLITSELGIGVNRKGEITDGITRLVVNNRGKVVPVITKEKNDAGGN